MERGVYPDLPNACRKIKIDYQNVILELKKEKKYKNYHKV